MSGIDYSELRSVTVSYGGMVFEFARDNWGAGVEHTGGRTAALALEALHKGRFELGFNVTEKAWIYADDRQASRLRALVFGTAFEVPELLELADLSPRRYVPGLWNHGTVPAFVAPKGFAKTWIVCQLAAALVGGRSFLDYFDPVELTDQERARNVILLNPETEPGAVHEVLVRAGLELAADQRPVYRRVGAEDGEGALIVEHLIAYEGGATAFDMSDAAKEDSIAELLISRSTTPPLTVIADGVTAMVGNSTARTGAWASAFMRTLTQVEIPNGLGVLHSPMSPSVATPMQGLESMGQWHGMWFGEATSFPVYPETGRTFRTVPRLGGQEVPKRALSNRDGLWALDASIEKGHSAPDGGKADPAIKEELLDKLEAAWPAKLWTTDTKSGEPGLLPKGSDYAVWRLALTELETEDRKVEPERQGGRAGGYKWGLTYDPTSGE